MSLSLEEVEHIAELARLELTPEEKERFRQQLSSILDYVARLQKLDTSTISSTSTFPPSQTSLREDHPHAGLSPDGLFRNAPQVEQQQYRVPPVLD